MKNIQIVEGYPDYIRVRMEERDLNNNKALPAHLNGHPVELVLEDLLLWEIGILKVSFKGGDVDLHEKIAETAAEWSKYANVQFDFGYNSTKQQYREWVPDDLSHIRVGFQEEGYWSLVGTDSQDPEICKPGEITLNLEKFDVDLPLNYKTTVLHEFGHSLGFHHEHQSPVSKCDFDWDKLYEYLAGPPNYWSREKVDFNLKKMPAGGLTYSPYDKYSIMHYSFPEWMFKSASASPCFVKENADLSEEDIRMAGKAYPFEKEKADQLKSIKKRHLEVLLDHKKTLKHEKADLWERRLKFLKKYHADNEFLEYKNKANIEERVKKSILIASGQATEDPENLENTMELAKLLPTTSAFQFLADMLDDLVMEYKEDAAVKAADIVNCGTVGDCIDLVKSKI
jgi:hypothetical protein